MKEAKITSCRSDWKSPQPNSFPYRVHTQTQNWKCKLWLRSGCFVGFLSSGLTFIHTTLTNLWLTWLPSLLFRVVLKQLISSLKSRLERLFHCRSTGKSYRCKSRASRNFHVKHQKKKIADLGIFATWAAFNVSKMADLLLQLLFFFSSFFF